MAFTFFSCKSQLEQGNLYQSENLKIEKIGKNVWIHTSYLDIPDYGKFPCNGLIYANGKEAVIFDTPIDNKVSAELIEWAEKKQGLKIKGLVINHFHNDCLGGIKEFHKRYIMSYANNETIKLAYENGEIEPKKGFENSIELKIGDETVVTRFFGAGHTIDNVVTYIPSQKILFGGCLIKSIGSGKGSLADSDVREWSKTVEKIKVEYNDLKIVIPGHGKYGGTELLDYTMKLFDK